MKILLLLAPLSCSTTQNADTTPASGEKVDPQIHDALVDLEVMTDRPIEAASLEPEVRPKKKHPI
jgi:hypothetical protein